jgi:site-specific DNA-methyltransferase (adenine-specific)
MLELNGFYNMDCMDGMKRFPDKYFELAIVDPPYGIGMGGGLVGNSKIDYKQFAGCDQTPPEKEYFQELFRISKNQIIWGANHFIEQFNKNSSCWIVWDKIQPENFTMAMCELAWTSFDTPAKIYKKRVVGADKDGRIHPTQKPVALYAWLLQNYAKKGDKILDTHVGSASSLIACHKLGFDYVGFELDPDYYKAATARLEAVKSQISIFDEPEPTEKWEQAKFI